MGGRSVALLPDVQIYSACHEFFFKLKDLRLVYKHTYHAYTQPNRLKSHAS